MILLQAASASPQGAISWGWAWGIAAGIIVLLAGVLVKLGAIVWSQYKQINDNRMEEQKQHHSMLRRKFDEMKTEFRSEKEATRDLISAIDKRVEKLEDRK